MTNHTSRTFIISAAILCATAGFAEAQDPKFSHSSEEDLEELKKQADKVEWKAGALAGLILTRGNARTTTLSAGAKASRKSGNNKLQIDLGGAFARSSFFRPNDANGNGAISENEYDRLSQTTARMLEGKARYDRFLSDHDALYASLQGLTNEPAGKEFTGGGQAGYSRTAFKDDKHNLVVEAGYDYSYEKPVTDAGWSNHSLRAFAGYESKLTKDSGFDASIEGLFNVNELDVPTRPMDSVGAFEDARINTQLALTTKLFEDISFRFGFAARYDNVPSPLPAFSTPFEMDYLPEAQKLDTKAEANLIISFL
ncbi:MAG: DUF481 domain-containing protein [Myxococcales bacterium]|nr:DUF481 domain-containing protein [Myxococcales bacterium]